ncbi:tumor necrosis factor alpha-induced protein 8-like protein [Phymastichus coffea]|uniref:tumor necrosis factor alpha-induced protein 8-like protein n=1 Tax=Phymastichus coffea TaxID=108790 RepID=UPI00273CD236|nr:tumor necrosis factor alpha-induced protein 8-like protein [Phymastichus coffea]XP_058805104.1 tumor necrosis factor alpha-induced protein 8-like protein [Phymastichus coffea]XP_058805105.1 tumor necrosis factor alpha-induced protein 8-like protein [Phymastichus coffea]
MPHAIESAAPDQAAASQQPGASRARELGLRAQKKLLSRLAASQAGKALLIDEPTSALLDNLHALMERAARGRPELLRRQPDKVLKNVVKLSVKVGLLQRGQQLGAADAGRVLELRRALRAAALAALSFYELEFSFDRGYMSGALERCRAALQALIRPHLSDKSLERVDQVFDFVAHPDFLEAVFGQGSALRPALGALVLDLDKALEAGQL